MRPTICSLAVLLLLGCTGPRAGSAPDAAAREAAQPEASSSAPAACSLEGTWTHATDSRLGAVVIKAQAPGVYAFHYTTELAVSATGTVAGEELTVVDRTRRIERDLGETQVGSPNPVMGPPSNEPPTPAPPPTTMGSGARPTYDPRLPDYRCRPAADCRSMSCQFVEPDVRAPAFTFWKQE